METAKPENARKQTHFKTSTTSLSGRNMYHRRLSASWMSLLRGGSVSSTTDSMHQNCSANLADSSRNSSDHVTLFHAISSTARPQGSKDPQEYRRFLNLIYSIILPWESHTSEIPWNCDAFPGHQRLRLVSPWLAVVVTVSAKDWSAKCCGTTVGLESVFGCWMAPKQVWVSCNPTTQQKNAGLSDLNQKNDAHQKLILTGPLILMSFCRCRLVLTPPLLHIQSVGLAVLKSVLAQSIRQRACPQKSVHSAVALAFLNHTGTMELRWALAHAPHCLSVVQVEQGMQNKNTRKGFASRAASVKRHTWILGWFTKWTLGYLSCWLCQDAAHWTKTHSLIAQRAAHPRTVVATWRAMQAVWHCQLVQCLRQLFGKHRTEDAVLVGILVLLRGCSKSVINSVFSATPFLSVPKASSRAWPTHISTIFYSSWKHVLEIHPLNVLHQPLVPSLGAATNLNGEHDLWPQKSRLGQ